MKKLFLLFTLILGLIPMSQAKVAFLVPADNTGVEALQYEENDGFEQSPERRAWYWFNENFVASSEGQFLCFNDLSNIPSDVHTLWVYVDRVGFTAEDFDALFTEERVAQLQSFVNAGGNVLLAKQATRLEKDLVGATMDNDEVITPDYNCGGYIDPATWAVDYYFFDLPGWGSNISHPIFKDAPHKNENEAELIWTDGKRLTNNNCGMGIGAFGMADKDDYTALANFQGRNNCRVLGSWANGNTGCEYGGIIEFNPNSTRKGAVLMFGLAAYSWSYSNAGNGWDNTQVITRSALKYLEHMHPAYALKEVAYLLPSSIESLKGWYDGEQPEHNAAVWFNETYVQSGKGCFITIQDLPYAYAAGVRTLWVNIERVGISPEDGLFSPYREALSKYIQAGGNVLLTKQAVYLTYTMGRIGYAPAFNSALEYTTEDRGNERSMLTVMGLSECVDEQLNMSGHQLYNNMLGYWEAKNMFLVGAECKKTYDYCSWQDFFRASDDDTHYDNCLIQRVRDFETDWNATVLAIQGNIGDYCLSNIVEFNATEEWPGRILTIGAAAYQWGTSNNGIERNNVTTLTTNALAYLQNEPIEEKVYTRYSAPQIFSTICMDYAVAADKIEGAEVYSIYSFDQTGDSVILVRKEAMEAGVPYIYYTTTGVFKMTFSGVREEAKAENGLIGYINLYASDTKQVDEGMYIIEDNAVQAVKSDAPKAIQSGMAYVDAAQISEFVELPQEVEYTKIEIIKAQPSGIEDVDAETLSNGIYDLLGRKVSNPSRGIYILNGQKVWIQ